MNNVEALQALYAALGGDPADVANASTSVEVLNAIAAKFDGEDDATINPDAISNIAAIAGDINAPTLTEKTVTANGTYAASSDNADGYSEVTVNVPTGTEINGAAMYTSTRYHKKVFFGDDSVNDRGSIKSVLFPDGVTSVADYSLGGCNNLEAIVIPNGVTSIGASAFGGDSALKTVVIPNTVTSINYSAFSGCSDITIIINRTTGSISGSPWNATNANVIWTG